MAKDNAETITASRVRDSSTRFVAGIHIWRPVYLHDLTQPSSSHWGESRAGL